MNFNRQLLAVAALSLLASAASAKVLLAATRASNFTFTASGTAVPLDAGGSTTLSFTAKKNGVYVLTYSAECSADNGAATNAGWIDLDIQINGATVAPTLGTADAFCSPDGFVGSSGWVRPSITVPINLVAGPNTVRILGNVFAPVTTGWLGDASLVIHD
jgi:hypothetical protein